MQELSTTGKFWYVARHVLRSPLSLALWAAGGVVSLVTGWWLYLLLAAIAQGALLLRRLHDEEYLRRIFLERQEREEQITEQEVEELLERMDFETRQRVRYVLQLQKEIVREARAPDVQEYARRDMDRIASQMPALVRRAVSLATRKQQLARYLHHVDERALRSYCANLRQRIDGTTDSVARAQYEQALKAREAELNTYQAITQATARIDSQLENVEATFASWKAKVLRIKTVDMSAAASVSEGLYRELETLNSDIDLLDTSVTEALAAEEPAPLRQNP